MGACSGQVQCVRSLLCDSKVKSYLKRNCLLKNEKIKGVINFWSAYILPFSRLSLGSQGAEQGIYRIPFNSSVLTDYPELIKPQILIWWVCGGPESLFLTGSSRALVHAIAHCDTDPLEALCNHELSHYTLYVLNHRFMNNFLHCRLCIKCHNIWWPMSLNRKCLQ